MNKTKIIGYGSKRLFASWKLFRLIRHDRAPFCRAGGSATGLSATGAWTEPLPVMVVNIQLLTPFRTPKRPNAALRDRLFSSELALPESLPNLFRAAGFLEVQQASLTIRMKYANFDDCWRPLLAGQAPVGTYVASLVGNLRLNVEDAARRAY
jgi:hypothetical protein